MLTITQNQALQRWDTLPDILREALYAEANSDFLWKTCEKENVPGEKTYDVARIAGYVLLGFIHPGDMAEELKEELNLDPKTCAAVSSALDVRIFAPLRSNIDKIYEPLSKFAGAPKIIQDIGPVPAATTPAPTALPMARVTAAPPPSAPPATMPKLSEVGWSKTTPEAPVVRLSQTSAAPPRPPGAPTAASIKGPIGEFERTPAPVIIHEDIHVQPLQKSADFRLVKPGDTAAVMPGVGAPKPQPPLKPAVLELGRAALPSPPAASKPAASPTPPRVVHYTDYKAPPSPQGTRHVTEITSQQGVLPPKPPTPPSAPPSPPRDKVVYKNYSEPQTPPQTLKTPPMPPAPPTPPMPPPPPIKK